MEKWNVASDGEPTEAAIRAKMMKLGCASIDRYVYLVGCYFAEHTHTWDKLDAVVSGHLRVVLNSVAHDLGPGDMIHVPKNKPHTAEVIGNSSCVSFDGSMN